MHDLNRHDLPDDLSSDSLFRLDNVYLTTVGVDVGSSTFLVMFARVHLARAAQSLSARYEVVEREILWRSRIELTPYSGKRIDAEIIGSFVAQCYERAGLASQDIDSGAVILTGEALLQHNARSIADGIAGGSGKFVCVTAGHHLEAMLSAHGSGATEYSKQTGARLLHVDIGGGTTKLALIDGGQVRATAALKIGGRQVSWNADRRVLGKTAGAKTVARAAGVELVKGARFSADDEERFVRSQVAVIFSVIARRSDALSRRLRLTPVLPNLFEPEMVSFSGGVSEYIFGRGSGEYGDLGRSLGETLRAGIESEKVGVPVIDPGEGIRATVVGASQCSVQLSGNTVMITDGAVLPIHDVPVIHPDVPAWSDEHPLRSEPLAAAIKKAVETYGYSMRDPVALAFSWRGDPSYQRLTQFTSGLREAIDIDTRAPVVVMMDADVGQSVGRLLTSEFSVTRPVICLDGLELSPLDYVDVGAVLEPSQTVPVVIKSLLFGARK